jgi:hypothetical protein
MLAMDENTRFIIIVVTFLGGIWILVSMLDVPRQGRRDRKAGKISDMEERPFCWKCGADARDVPRKEVWAVIDGDIFCPKCAANRG